MSDSLFDAPGPAPQALFRRIDHVGIAVDDLDAAIALYTERFGLTVVHIEDNEEQGVREAMLTPGPAPDGTGGTMVQLVAPLGPGSPVAKFLRERRPGLHHLAFSVDDLEKAATELRDRDVDVLWDEGRRGTNGTRVNFVHPRLAGGILIELVESLDRSH